MAAQLAGWWLKLFDDRATKSDEIGVRLSKDEACSSFSIDRLRAKPPSNNRSLSAVMMMTERKVQLLDETS
jgi:hypothetical protein